MKLLLFIGTRPEAIKMAGLVYALRRQSAIEWRLVSSGQHRTMLDETLFDLGIAAHQDLNIMQTGGGLAGLTTAAIQNIDPVIADYKPDWVLVQGDTTTAMSAALAAFYNKVPVAHVEAGLRTWNRYSPWPEEVNRKLIGSIATRHYAPTATSRDNLLREGISATDVVVTGNTVIDALLEMSKRTADDTTLRTELQNEFGWTKSSKRMILVTGHRRESFGEGFQQICQALLRLAAREDVQIVYPVHLNPNVQGPVQAMLSTKPNIHLIAPQRYSRFVHLMTCAHILLTDSGGIQEEGPSLGKPVLVMRDTSERPEAIAAGTARLVSADADRIVREVENLLDDGNAYAAMSQKTNPYGDGHASERIIQDLLK